jgi:hypothetical protein
MPEINLEELFRAARSKESKHVAQVSMRAEAVSTTGSGGTSGYLNVCGELDSWRSVVFPNAWKPHTKRFITEGKMLFGHQWYAPEIGVVIDSKEKIVDIEGVGRRSVLWWSNEYHDDDFAQRIRGIAVKRFNLGKTVDFSVGFWPDWNEVAEFKNGKDLWTFAEGKGCDMSLFNPEIKKFDSWCWAIPSVRSIAEGSQVNDGATPHSEATDVRTMFNDLSSGALAASLPDHLDTVLAAVQGVTSRVRSVRTRRVEDSRELSLERVAQVDEVLAALQELRAECQTSLQQPAGHDEIAKRFDEIELAARFARHAI